MDKLRFGNLAFFKFFSELKKFSPKLFYFSLSFFSLQIFLLVLKLEVTPFFLYGMYSEKISFNDTMTVRKILIDGIPLNTLKIPSRSRDILETSLDNYFIMKENYSTDPVKTRVETKYPFFTNSLVYPLIKDKIYNPPESLINFETWFKYKCSNYLEKPVKKVYILHDTYHINSFTSPAKSVKLDTIAQF